MLATKLLTGHSGYDVVMPAGGPTYRLIQVGALRKLDKSKLGNLGNLEPQFIADITNTVGQANGNAASLDRPSTGPGRTSRGARSTVQGEDQDCAVTRAGP